MYHLCSCITIFLEIMNNQAHLCALKLHYIIFHQSHILSLKFLTLHKRVEKLEKYRSMSCRFHFTSRHENGCVVMIS